MHQTRKTILELGNGRADTVQTGPFGAQLHAEDYTEEGVPLILIRNITDKGLNTDGIPRISIADAKRLSRYSIREGDIVFSRVGRVGSCFLALEEHNGWIISGQTLRIRLPENAVNSKYLIYALRDKRCQDFIAGVSVGTTRTSINTQILESLSLSLPEPKEQAGIAAILSCIDRAIEQTEAIIAKQQRIKIGLMQDLLTKGIDEHGNIRSEATHEFMDSPLGRVPKEWDVNELRHYISYISYGFTNPMPEAGDGPYLVTAANINAGKILYDTCRKTSIHAFNKLLTNKSRPKLNDLLITKDGSLGRLAVVDRTPLCINQSVAIMRTNERVEVHFLKLLLESPRYQKTITDEAGGSTIKHIYITKIDRMRLSLPRSKDEQERILKIIDKYNAAIEVEQIKLSVFKSTKQGLMQDLLTGTARVDSLLVEHSAASA